MQEPQLKRIKIKSGETQQELTITLPKKALRPKEEEEEIDLEVSDQVFADDYSTLKLKPDAQKRPMWVCHDGKIILEAFSPLVEQAQDFLITIAEPVTRPARIHEYKLTAYSLYAAVSVGMTTDLILKVLNHFSKVQLPSAVVKFIKDCTYSYGKVKLVLKHNKYYIESCYPDILRFLLREPVIKEARVVSNHNFVPQSTEFGALITVDKEDEMEENRTRYDPVTQQVITEEDYTESFEIQTSMVEDVKRRCIDLDYPLMEEYDFRQDDVNANLDIELSPRTVIRDYQEKCLSKMFGGGTMGGRARSGIIVLPTGAGKTLVGITAICTVKKSTLVLCTNALSVEQWANELKKWSTIKDDRIAKFTADHKQKFEGDAGVVISTYTMISHTGKRAWDTQKMIEFVNGHEWGLMILDEVHVVPANVFRKVLSTVAAHTKLGLTATLVREDDKIEDLNFLIGPKLYEANWSDLANRGHIAKVEATEIWCPMTGEFYAEYTKSRPAKRRLYCVMNPIKFMVTEYLIKWRETMGDKIIVFSDNVFALQHYAVTLGRPFIYGATSHEERSRILALFRQKDGPFRTVFLSKVGDTSLDLPEATCLIQISSQFGSRRQEAQRMGRILRANRRHEEGFRCRFYTLVSKDTDEVMFSARRRTFLVDQGYEFKVVPNYNEIIPKGEESSLHYSNKTDQAKMLALVKQQQDEVGLQEIIKTTADDIAGVWEQMQQQKQQAQMEAPPPPKKDKKTHSLFKAWRKKK